MIRLVALCALFVLLLSPATTAAQDPEHLGHGAGTPADQATADSVIAFVSNFIESLNAKDPSIVNVASENGLGFFLTNSYDEALNNVASGRIATIVPYDISDVLTHADGAVSARVTFTGYTMYFDLTLQTERWYMLPDGNGSFILDGYDWLPVYVPESMTSSAVSLTLTNQGLELTPIEVPAADVVVFDVTSAEANWTSTGIYSLEGTTAEETQAALAVDPLAVQDYVGKTPMFPGPGEWSFGFVLPPGDYLVQQYSLDESGGNPQPLLEGDAFIATLTVTPQAEATPGS